MYHQIITSHEKWVGFKLRIRQRKTYLKCLAIHKNCASLKQNLKTSFVVFVYKMKQIGSKIRFCFLLEMHFPHYHWSDPHGIARRQNFSWALALLNRLIEKKVIFFSWWKLHISNKKWDMTLYQIVSVPFPLWNFHHQKENVNV